MIKFSSSSDFETNLSLDLTPLLDILFLIRICLTLVAHPALLKIDVDLPKISDNTSQQIDLKNKITLEIHEDYYKINQNSFLNWQAFLLKVKQIALKFPQTNFIIATDKKIKIEKFLYLLHFLQKNNIIHIDTLIKP